MPSPISSPGFLSFEKLYLDFKRGSIFIGSLKVYRKRLKRCDKSAIILLMRRDPLKSNSIDQSGLLFLSNFRR
jgi:hypothetical protein